MHNFYFKFQSPPSCSTGLSIGLVLLTLWPSFSNSAPILPSLPQKSIDTTYSPPTGKVITVNKGGDFQVALNSANLGDTIVLQAGATFTGPFILPNKTAGSGWIYIRTSNYSSLPSQGKRVSPANAGNMAKIVVKAISGGAIQTESIAHHYRFVGLEFSPSTGETVNNIITIGNTDTPETSPSALPHDITFDRCYIHGDKITGGRRGIAMNGISVAVVDSYIADFKQSTNDTQALWSYNSPGPLKIVNNYLEATGENVMFGGADPKIPNLVPSDIEIKKNNFFKPLSWINSAWTVKNLLEFKNARRVLVENNTFENIWGADQVGFAVLITPKNQEGTAPWTITEDITFKSNVLKNVGSGINISGVGSEGGTTQATARILVENNIFEVTGKFSDGRIFQILEGPDDITINHNTGLSKGPFGMTDFGDNGAKQKGSRFLFTNNIMTKGDWGFKGTDASEGTGTLNMFFTNWIFSKNVIIGGAATDYPGDNYFPAAPGLVGFANYTGGNYELSASSLYKNKGSDGKDLGANLSAIGNASIGSGAGNALVHRAM